MILEAAMRIITNPGSNVPRTMVEHYGIDIMPQKIVVDGVEHDTREGVSIDTVDHWVDTAQGHPYVLGTSTAEFAGYFADLAKADRELLVVMSSRKIIQSHDAALAAARTLQARPSYRDVVIRVVDTGMTDLGAGVPTVIAALAREAGLSMERIAELLTEIAACSTFCVLPRTLDNLIKGGRAGFLRGWLAKMLGLRPLLGMVEGELQVVGKCSSQADQSQVLADWFREHVQADRVWVGASHGGDAEQAERFVDRLRASYEVEVNLVVPTSPAVYLHGARGVLAAVVVPLDGLPWQPGPPMS